MFKRGILNERNKKQISSKLSGLSFLAVRILVNQKPLLDSSVRPNVLVSEAQFPEHLISLI